MKKTLLGIALLMATAPALAAEEYMIFFTVCGEPIAAIAQDESGDMRIVTQQDMADGNADAAFLRGISERVGDALVINSDDYCGIPL